MLFCAAKIKNQLSIQLWKKSFNKHLQEINSRFDRMEHSQSVLRFTRKEVAAKKASAEAKRNQMISNSNTLHVKSTVDFSM